MATHTGSILSSIAEESWYWYYNQLFTPAQVDRIHRICTRNDEEEALTGDNHDPDLADYTIRKNKVIWSSDDELFGMLFPKLNEANAAAGWHYNITCCEPCQYTIYYGDNNHYDWHTDTSSTMPTEGITANTIRKISCVIQLSDAKDYEGGDFNLVSVDTEKEGEAKTWQVRPVDIPHMKQKGAAIFFPSTLFHRVRPITDGTRRTLVTWFRGPKWI